jgi:D-beta-D-heptose 7-phosphate kinase/D-beta-D-heptose 1-phosphate adenosyltransferase
MGKILKINNAVNTAKRLKREGGEIVLAGGCFDILHRGHIEFLKKAKQKGILFVLLESDEAVRLRKGDKRPVNSQKDRAVVLANLSMVDFVVLLPTLKTDKQYFNLVKRIKPDIIAITEGDPLRHKKEEQAKQTNAKVVAVIKRIKEYSTSRILQGKI